MVMELPGHFKNKTYKIQTQIKGCSTMDRGIPGSVKTNPQTHVDARYRQKERKAENSRWEQWGGGAKRKSSLIPTPQKRVPYSGMAPLPQC